MELGQTKETIVAQHGRASEENHSRNTATYRRAGWKVDWTRSPAFAGRDRYLDRATFGTTREFNSLQWHLLAHA